MLEFAKVEDTNSIEAYENFLRKYSSGDFSNKARLAIENVYYEEAVSSKSITELEKYLS